MKDKLPVLTIGTPFAPTTMDPAKSAQSEFTALTNASLVHMDADGSFKPSLALSWRYLPGSKNSSFEFTLRPGVYFSDGELVTAAAVKTWFGYFAQAQGPYISLLGSIKSVKTFGKWKVRLNLKAPNPLIPMLLSDRGGYGWGSISAPHAVANPSVLGTQTFGAGPYVLSQSETVTGDHYTFIPNKRYYDPTIIHYSKIVVKVIPNASSMLQALQAGQIDVARGDPTTFAAAYHAGFTVLHYPFVAVVLTIPDLNGKIVPALADVRVRQALSYAIDRKAIASAITFGRPTSQMPSLDGWVKNLVSYYDYNPTKAKSLLAAAGYPNGFTITVAPQGFSGGVWNGVVQAVANYWNAIGVKTTIIPANTLGDWLGKINGGTIPVIEHAAFFSRSMWIQYGFYFKPGGLFDQAGWHDSQLDSFWAAGQVADDPAQIWQTMSKLIVSNAYMLPVATVDNYYYLTKHVHGVTVSSKGMPYYPDFFSR